MAAPPTSDAAAPLGLVLAGGRARRMGGGDKPLLLLGGRPLVAHVLARVGPSCAGMAISANGDPAPFSRFGWPILPDTVPGWPGPLAGILAGLDHAARHRPYAADILVVPGDAPVLPADLLPRLRSARAAAGARLACAASGGRRHPTVGLWAVALRGELRHLLVDEGERRAGVAAERLGAAVADWPAEPHDPFLNLNTPADLAAAEARLAGEVTPCGS